jgi:hypothetical protein
MNSISRRWLGAVLKQQVRSEGTRLLEKRGGKDRSVARGRQSRRRDGAEGEERRRKGACGAGGTDEREEGHDG